MFGTGDIRLPGAMPVYSTTTEPTEERGKLTLLPGGRFILGCPRDSTPDERGYAQELLVKWTQDSLIGVALPFPVDVEDLR